VKIFGEEAPPNFKPLTVRALKEFIERYERSNGIGSLDKHWVHFLCMEGDEENGVATRYATHVEVDCFDNDTGDPDTGTVAYWCLSLTHEPSRKKGM
jgi:hypothetical protein